MTKEPKLPEDDIEKVREAIEKYEGAAIVNGCVIIDVGYADRLYLAAKAHLNKLIHNTFALGDNESAKDAERVEEVQDVSKWPIQGQEPSGGVPDDIERFRAWHKDLVLVLELIRDGKHRKQIPETAQDIIMLAAKIYRDYYQCPLETIDEIQNRVVFTHGQGHHSVIRWLGEEGYLRTLQPLPSPDDAALEEALAHYEADGRDLTTKHFKVLVEAARSTLSRQAVPEVGDSFYDGKDFSGALGKLEYMRLQEQKHLEFMVEEEQPEAFLDAIKQDIASYDAAINMVKKAARVHLTAQKPEGEE